MANTEQEPASGLTELPVLLDEPPLSQNPIFSASSLRNTLRELIDVKTDEKPQNIRIRSRMVGYEPDQPSS